MYRCAVLFFLIQFIDINCRVLKRVGGTWLSRARKQIDADKFVCLDRILNKDDCIVYSFGINTDWTFEDEMDGIGRL